MEGNKYLEDEVGDFDPQVLGGEVDANRFRAMVKLSRGIFTPGVHLTLTPRGDDISVTARLQEGRQYLETDAEILFSRYGTGLQEWTMVGSIGAYAVRAEVDEFAQFTFADDTKVIRSKFAKYVNYFMQVMGNFGFADLAQFPGFSIVPLFVYRTVTPPVRADRLERTDGAVI